MIDEEEEVEAFSTFSKILLGSISGLFGVMMIAIAPPTEKAIFFYLFGGFCLAICLACVFKGRLRQFIGSSIGSCVFLLALWYLASQFMDGPIVSGGRSEPSVFNAIMFLVVFGLPGLAYATKAKFGIHNKKP